MNELLTPEEQAQEVKRLVSQLQAEGRTDLLLHAIGVPLLEELRIEAAKGRLSRLVITKDYRFILEDYQKEVELQPVHKAVYLLFLALCIRLCICCSWHILRVSSSNVW